MDRQLISADADNVVGILKDTVVVQVRTGALSVTALYFMEHAIGTITKRGAPAAVVAVIEPTALTPTPDVWAVQQQVIERIAAMPRTRLFNITHGADAAAQVRRDRAALLATRNAAVVVPTDLVRVAVLASEHMTREGVDVTAADVMSMVDWLRAQ